MISIITGTVLERGDDAVIVNVCGIGFRLVVPTTVLNSIPSIGHKVTLRTYLHLRENEITLFGFSDEQELWLFERLIAISGVGPRVAMSLLSNISPGMLAEAVSRNEWGVLQKVPGVGRKTAERIIFYLKDKITPDRISVGLTEINTVEVDAIAALTSLGYSVIEAQTAVQKVSSGESRELEETIRLALSSLGR